MHDGLILKKLKVWCLLLLAAIGAHALIPVSVSEARAAGSPFSPSTIDVSTAHNRRTMAEQKAARFRDPHDRTSPAMATIEDVAPLCPATIAAPSPRWAVTAPRAPPASPRCLTRPRAPPSI